jgi:hypothetical protein
LRTEHHKAFGFLVELREHRLARFRKDNQVTEFGCPIGADLIELAPHSRFQLLRQFPARASVGAAAIGTKGGAIPSHPNSARFTAALTAVAVGSGHQIIMRWRPQIIMR